MKHDDPEIEKWLAEVNDAVNRDMVPKMRSSAFALGIVDEHLDAYMLMQVGAALLLDKPLILLVLKGAWVPKKARELADTIVEVDSIKTPEGKEKIQAAITNLVERLAKERRRQ